MVPLALLLLAACPEPETAAANPTGDGLFTGGCPVAKEARARVLTEVSERPWGEEGLAAPGDVLLLSETAAFVIQGPGDPRTYYHYGGTPIDAVAVDDCEQAGPELLEELGLVLGRLELTDFEASVLRQFRAEEVVVVSDGHDGGPAVVEARGSDDRFWLVELTLVRQSYANGTPRYLQDLFGLEVTVRYTLDPGSAVLQLDVELDGEPATDGFMAGAIVFPSDNTPVNTYATGDLSVGGFGLDVGVPWLGMGNGEGSFAVAMPGANVAYTSVAGVRALLDLNQALDPLEVSGAAVARTPLLLAVGRTDPASASAQLEPYLEPTAGQWATVSGLVTDTLGQPVAGAAVEVRPGAGEGVLDRFWTDERGTFNGRTLDLGDTTLVAVQAGRDSGSTEVGALVEGLTLGIGAAGTVSVDATDGDGEPMPVRAEFQRDDGTVAVVYAMPGESYPLAPGSWTAYLSRGYEYTLATATVTVPAGGRGTVVVSMDRVVDTRGWASVDTHVHQEASADSSTLDRDRFRTVAASGLDAFVSTDHEAIVDLQPEISDLGFDRWFAYGLGSEVTATVPEHVNAWPFPPTSDERGDSVAWYQLGFPGLYEAIRERGATVVQLNHARVNGECGILCILDWDRQSDPPSMADPEAIGLPVGTEVWSWDFDAFELLNDPRSPLLDPDDPQHTGALYDWLAFHNLGYRVAAMGVTDAHGLDIPGSPRTYVQVDDDTAGVLDIRDTDDGILAGATVVSAGAFALVDVDGAGPGQTVSSDAAVLHLDVRGLPEVDVQRVDVLVNCQLYASVAVADPGAVQKLLADFPLDLEIDSHVVTLGWGEWAMPRGLLDYDALGVPRFVSSPVFVDVDGDGVWTPPGPQARCDG